MKSITNSWTLIYKEKGTEPLVFTYTSEKDAVSAKLMVDDSNGGELIDGKGNVAGDVELEWCTLYEGKLIQSN